jgi:hypothetical protein
VAGNAGNAVEELRTATAVSVVFDDDVVFEDVVELLASNDDVVVVGAIDGISFVVVVIVSEFDDVNTVLSLIDDDVEIGMGVCTIIVADVVVVVVGIGVVC